MASLPIVQKGKIILNGENPFIWLHETKDGPRTTEASIWTVTYSEVGAGHILFIKSELTDNKWQIYSDNKKLVRWIQSTVQGMLNPETADLSIEVIEAKFTQIGNTQSKWSQIVKSAQDEIIMTWERMTKPILVQDEPITEPGRPFGVSAVMIPAKSAVLTLNGIKAKGQIFPMDLNGTPFSTGALAFSENWRTE